MGDVVDMRPKPSAFCSLQEFVAQHNGKCTCTVKEMVWSAHPHYCELSTLRAAWAAHGREVYNRLRPIPNPPIFRENLSYDPRGYFS